MWVQAKVAGGGAGAARLLYAAAHSSAEQDSIAQLLSSPIWLHWARSRVAPGAALCVSSSELCGACQAGHLKQGALVAAAFEQQQRREAGWGFQWLGRWQQRRLAADWQQQERGAAEHRLAAEWERWREEVTAHLRQLGYDLDSWGALLEEEERQLDQQRQQDEEEAARRAAQWQRQQEDDRARMAEERWQRQLQRQRDEEEALEEHGKLGVL